MRDKHKEKTISFRVSENQRRLIEEKIRASGMRKKDFYVRSCINNQVCVVGKKETIEPLVEEVRKMHAEIIDVMEMIEQRKELDEKHVRYLEKVQAVVWLLEGAKYL